MRVILVGAPAARARLRAHLNGALEVLAEFDTERSAREAGLESDAVVVVADPARRNGTRASARADEGAGDTVASEPLTRRELAVLELLADGLSNKAIGRRLGISDQTVKFHVASLSGKLGAANRTDAVRRALRRGLVPL